MTDQPNTPIDIYVPKVGERVRIVDAAPGYEHFKGRVGAVSRFTNPRLYSDNMEGYYVVHLDFENKGAWCRVAPASLAAEQGPFEVGDHVVGDGPDTGTPIVGLITRFDDYWRNRGGKVSVAYLDNGQCVLRSSLRHESPPPAKRPECDACGKESCNSPAVKEMTDFRGWKLCAACWALPDSTKMIACERRKQTPPVKAGSVQREQCESRSTALNGAEKPETAPPSPEATKRDPYAEHRRHLDRDMALVNDAAVAVATDRQNELRHNGWAKKRRQALAQLLRPLPSPGTVKVGYEAGQMGRCGRTVPNAHPEAWPEDAWMDAGSCDP